MATLPEELDRGVQAALEPGENLVWAGQPSANRFVWSTLLLFLCGFPCTGTGLALIWGVFTASHDLPVWLGRLLGLGAAVPVIFLGLWLIASPYWMYRRAKQTVYAVTDQRAIAWDAGWFGRKEVRYFPVHKLRHMILRENRDGSGDLIFNRLVSQETDSEGSGWTRVVEHGFFAIKNVREVEALIQGMLLGWE